MQELIAAVIGLIAGCVGSLIAPWVHWGIEKRRLQIQARRQLIDEAREYVGSKQFGGPQFERKTWFAQLRGELHTDTKSKIENFRERSGAAGDATEFRETLRRELFVELDRIERKWKLI